VTSVTRGQIPVSARAEERLDKITFEMQNPERVDVAGPMKFPRKGVSRPSRLSLSRLTNSGSIVV
jgi:hypothetical protein